MIRQLSSPLYTVTRAQQTTSTEVYKPTVLILMDCEMRPQNKLTIISDLSSLYTNYGTNSNNYSYNAAEMLLSTNNYRLICVNAVSSNNYLGTSVVYTVDDTNYEIHPNYNTILENTESSVKYKNLTNGDYSYTLKFGDAFKQNYAIIFPYTPVSNILIYLIYDIENFQKLNQDYTSKLQTYCNVEFKKSEETGEETSEIITERSKWAIELNDTWETFLNRVASLIKSFGLIVDNVDIENHEITVCYTFKTNYIIGTIDVALANESSDNLIYCNNLDSSILIAHSKNINLLNNIEIKIEKSFSEYSINIYQYDSKNESILDSWGISGDLDEFDEMIDYLNTYNPYVYFDKCSSENVPIGIFNLKNYRDSEVLAEDCFTSTLTDITEDVLLDNRVDFIYDYSKDETLNNIFVNLVDNAGGRCMYFTTYSNENFLISKFEALFRDYTFNYIFDNNEDRENFSYDFTLMMLTKLVTSGLEFELDETPNEEVDEEDIKTKYITEERLVTTIYDNIYYYAVLNPLCKFIGKLSVLDECTATICVINNALFKIQKNIIGSLSTNKTKSEVNKNISEAISECFSYFRVFPTIEIGDVSVEDRIVYLKLVVTLTNNVKLAYQTTINIQI